MNVAEIFIKAIVNTFSKWHVSGPQTRKKSGNTPLLIHQRISIKLSWLNIWQFYDSKLFDRDLIFQIEITHHVYHGITFSWCRKHTATTRLVNRHFSNCTLKANV